MTLTEIEKAQIYTDYSEKVLHYITGKVGDSRLAEDISSDVFLKVYAKLDTFDETKSSLSTWIYTITRNTLTDYYRTRRVMSEIPETLDDGSSVEESVLSDMMLDKLADALESLVDRERDIIVLHYYSGMTLTAIAERMSISYSYVKALHNKAIASLRKYFD